MQSEIIRWRYESADREDKSEIMERTKQETSLKIIVRRIKQSITEPPERACAIATKRLCAIIDRSMIQHAAIYRRSVDARKKDQIFFVYSVIVDVCIPSKMLRDAERFAQSLLRRADAVLAEDTTVSPVFGTETLPDRPVVVGFGPAGMFCALLLAENGYRPIVIERGGDVQERIDAVEHFYRDGVLDGNTNIQFGAGGAGTFSDGKLMTRINDVYCQYVLRRFWEFGAPNSILTEAKPHIGTDILREVVSNIRDRIRAAGGTILFRTRMEDLHTSGNRVVSLRTENGDISCGTVTLAIGHSARDTYQTMMQKGFDIIPKSFAVGVRIEHLQEEIDRAMYGEFAGNPLLGHAEYALAYHEGENAVYSFCMCPGGEVVAAASESGGVVVNGMSRHARDGKNANAALVVPVSCEDPIAFQRQLERAAFEAAGADYCAPQQTVGDFLRGLAGSAPGRVQPTYRGGNYSKPCDLHTILPRNITQMLESGICNFARKIQGFDAPDALLTGVETRTSAPVRIRRGELLTATGYDNLYPCGEGAGYAGGITSAAVDGIRCALAIMKRYRLPQETQV